MPLAAVVHVGRVVLMEYGNPSGFALAMMRYHEETRDAPAEVRATLLAVRTMWEQQVAHWSNPVLDPMVAGAVLGLSIGRGVERARDLLEQDEQAADEAAVAHLYSVWRVRLEAEDAEPLPPDPFGEPRPLGVVRRLAVRLCLGLLLRALRVDRRVLGQIGVG